MLFSSPSNWCVRMKETRPTHWPHHPKKGNAFRPSAYLAWDQAPQRWKKAKTGSKRKNIGERSEPSGGLGRGKGPLPLGSPRSPIFFLFPPMRSLVLSYSLPFPPSIQVIFFFVFLLSSVELLNELTRRRLLRSRKTDGQEKSALSFSKIYENGACYCIFNLVDLIAHQTLEPFFIKTFCCRRLLSYHFIMVLLSSHYLSRPVCLFWGFWTDSWIREVYSDLVELVMAHKYWPSRSLAPPIPQGPMGILQCYCKIT